MRAETATAARGDVVGRRAAGLLRLAGAGALLVHRARGDLLGGVLLLAAVEQPFLDVLVLAFALVVPCLLGHRYLLTVGDCPSPGGCPRPPPAMRHVSCCAPGRAISVTVRPR